jgi:hypothetical protein
MLRIFYSSIFLLGCYHFRCFIGKTRRHDFPPCPNVQHHSAVIRACSAREWHEALALLSSMTVLEAARDAKLWEIGASIPQGLDMDE